MNYTNSPLATETVNFGTKNSNARDEYYADAKRKYNPTGVITSIVPHHMAGKMKAKDCANMHLRGNGSSANYYIGYDGEICLGVDESRRAWTSGSRECDSYAVTIEVSNDTNKAPWTVSDKAFESLIKLCIDICKRNDIKQLKFTGGKSGNLLMHRYFQNTSCPGDYLASKFPEIERRVNEALNPTLIVARRKFYYVEIGAYTSEAEAERACKKVRMQGLKATIRCVEDLDDNVHII